MILIMFRLAKRSAVQLGWRRVLSTAGPNRCANGRSRAYMMGVVSGVGAVGACAAVVLTNPDSLATAASCAGQRAGSINVRIVSYNVLSDSLCSSGCECCARARVCVCVCAVVQPARAWWE